MARVMSVKVLLDRLATQIISHMEAMGLDPMDPDAVSKYVHGCNFPSQLTRLVVDEAGGKE